MLVSRSKIFAASTGSATEPITTGKSKYGGMEALDIKKLHEVEEENGKPKKLFANLSLENAALKELIAKKGW